MAQLIAKIFQGEAIPSHGLGGHLLGLLLIYLLFRFFDQRENVAHSEDPRHNSIRMERFERVVFLAYADELNRLTCDLADRKRRATARIAVHFCEHNAGQRKFFVKFVRRAHRILTGHGISHKQNFLRIQQTFERLHLLHQLIVDV